MSTDPCCGSFWRTRHLDGEYRVGVISSVVPPVLTEVLNALQFWDIPTLVLSTEMDLGIRVDYRPRTSVGADRLANAIAVRKRYGCPAMIVDVGDSNYTGHG